MERKNQMDLSKRRLFWLAPCVVGALAFGTVGAQQPQVSAAGAQAHHPAPIPTAYCVINLLPQMSGLGSVTSFNARDQIAFGTGGPETQRVYFYDGNSVRDIGSLGGMQTFALGLNDGGEVVGRSHLADNATYHAFKWSPSAGMQDLGTLDGFGNSGATDINKRGVVVGESSSQTGTRAFRWTSRGGMEDLGVLPGDSSGFSVAHAINDAGTIAGQASGGGNAHAVVWKRKSGIMDLGTLGGSRSVAAEISEDGLVVGNWFTVDSLIRMFVWTREGGARSLGTAGGVIAYTSEKPISRNGNVIGTSQFADGSSHALFWSRSTGLIDIGRLGGAGPSIAFAVNSKGHVVGGSSTPAGGFTAIIWSATEGMIDLNTRVRNAPPDLGLFIAYGISDNGAILANSAAGWVLLTPDCDCARPHTVGPIKASAMIELGASYDASVSFADKDATAQHNVFWNWGDGSGQQQGNARERNGSGVASANHRYTAPGMYTVTAKVGNRAGASVEVSRTIVVYERATGAAGGNGWFILPAGANRKERGQAGRADFSFFSPGAASAKSTAEQARLQFHAGMLNFHSDSITPVALQGARGQFKGGGKLNGVGGYRFSLSATAGGSGVVEQPGRLGLKIWHVDPATKAEVVDYDNLGAGLGSVVPAAQGAIVLQP